MTDLQKIKKIEIDFAKWLLINGYDDALVHYRNAVIFFDFNISCGQTKPELYTIDNLVFFLRYYIKNIINDYFDLRRFLSESFDLLLTYMIGEEQMDNFYQLYKDLSLTVDDEQLENDLDDLAPENIKNTKPSNRREEFEQLASNSEHLGEENIKSKFALADWEKEYLANLCNFDIDESGELVSNLYQKVEYFQKGLLQEWLKWFYKQEISLLSVENRAVYSKILDLFITCNSKYGERDFFYYDDFECFVSWWYLEKYQNPTITEAQNIFHLFRKIAAWMSEQHQIMLDEEWPLAAMQELENDVLRVLKWRDKCFGQKEVVKKEIDFEEMSCSSDFFQVEQLIDNKAILLSLNTNEEERVTVSGIISEYLQVGDCLNICLTIDCFYDWQLTDREISGFFPRQAVDYLEF